MKNIYHYTKGIRVGSIIVGGGIIPGAQRKNRLPGDDLVWLTREQYYPKTALPAIAELPETFLTNQLRSKSPVDMLRVAEYVGGIWRFKFDATAHPEIKPWYGSYHRNVIVKTPYRKTIEKTAAQVGDKVELWAVAQGCLSTANCDLEQLTPQGWVTRLRFFERKGVVQVQSFGSADIQKIAMDSFSKKFALGA